MEGSLSLPRICALTVSYAGFRISILTKYFLLTQHFVILYSNRKSLFFSCGLYNYTLKYKLISTILCSFQVNGNMTVDGIDFYVTETFGEGLYESCKDVKFGTMNTRAIDFVGAGASNFKGDPL